MESEKMIAIKKQLEGGTRQVFESGNQYEEYLKFISKFPQYSYRNSLLIKMQMPKATKVAGIIKWQNQFGRKVKNEEKNKGIILIAPSIFKKDIETVKKDAMGELKLDDNGKVQVSSNEINVPYFRVITVYDVNQTEGRKLCIPRIEVNKGYEQKIKDMLNRDIFLNINVAADRETKNIQSQSIGYIVSNYFNLDSLNYGSFCSIDLWAKNKDKTVLSNTLNVIQKKSAQFIEQIEKSRGMNYEFTLNL